MGDVVMFPGIQRDRADGLPTETPKLEPVTEVVNSLRRMLDLAERGEIVGIGYTYVEPDHRFITGWQPTDTSGGVTRALISGAGCLQFRMCDYLTAEGEPVPDEPGDGGENDDKEPA